MVRVIGVQFLSGLKVYDFKSGGRKVAIRDYVLVETSQGEEIGKVVYINKEINEKKLESPLKEIKKVLTDDDKRKLAELKKRGAEALSIFKEKIKKHRLEMKPITVDFSLDGEKMNFYFTAENRVDFRNLARDLSRTFRKQIKMKQIGSRDSAKILGGFGMCGRPVCCRSFLLFNETITIDMARAQLEGNVLTDKISGLCGRLMCCLAFEKIEKKEKKGKQ